MEEAFFHLLRVLQKRSGLTDLSLAGGCAMNSVANGKVRRMTPFRRVYVQPAAGDAGGAIGSAFAVWYKLGSERTFVMDHAYWGPAFSAADISHLLAAHQSDAAAADCTLELSSTRQPSADGPRQISLTEKSSDGFNDGWNGARGHSETARSFAARAALI